MNDKKDAHEIGRLAEEAMAKLLETHSYSEVRDAARAKVEGDQRQEDEDA